MNTTTSLSAVAVLLMVGGCGSTTQPDFAPPVADPPSTDTVEFTVLTTRTLDADGDQSGLDAYDLIRDFGGDYDPGPIEAPDLYSANHPGVKHIYEDFDATIGNHFVFIIHRDIDKDRDRLENTDRQRNEIKTYDKSGEAVGGDTSHPILTISGAERSGEDGIEVRYSPLQQDTILERQNWNMVTGGEAQTLAISSARNGGSADRYWIGTIFALMTKMSGSRVFQYRKSWWRT